MPLAPEPGATEIIMRTPIMDFRMIPSAPVEPHQVQSTVCPHCGKFMYQMIPGRQYATFQAECLCCNKHFTVG